MHGKKETIPVNDHELEKLVDRGYPVRRLIDHNQQGLTLLYFVREKQGGIGLVRNLIERQLQIGRVVKGLNFIWDEDNEIKEIVTLKKHAKEIVAANGAFIKANKKSMKKRSFLGEFIPKCNPYIPVWADNIEKTALQRKRRTEHHVRRLIGQWQQCATKVKNEDIQLFFQNRVQQVTKNDEALWGQVVHSIEIDQQLQTPPKVYGDEQAEKRQGHKRDAHEIKTTQ